MEEVESEFILSPDQRPNLQTIEAQNIPLIDLSHSDSQFLVAEIGRACKNWGFFQVINHGVPPNCRQKIESASKKFFSLPKQDKDKIRRDEINPYGYYDTEHTKNVRDWKQIFDFTVPNPTILPSSHLTHDLHLIELYNKWPQNLPELREAVEEYAAEMEKLGLRVLELVAMSLGLRKDRFNPYLNYKDQTSIIRLNYYPSCPDPRLALGVGRHKDGGALTILAQDGVGGLEVKRQTTDGQWILVKPTPHAYIVNLGDIIQVWSNDEYKSVEHRAMVNSEKERFSIPFFFNPAHYTWVEPLEELLSEENPSKYRGYSWGKFLVTRNRGNFKKLHVKNIQISDFRIRLALSFILAPEHRPKLQTIEAKNIPLIDLSHLNSNSQQTLVAEIGNACKNWGFFQVINHGVPSNCRQKLESASKKFFSLPKEEKDKIIRDEIIPFGYYDTEHTKNVRDWKQVFDCTLRTPTFLPVSHHPHDTELKQLHNKWPHNLPELREAVEEYAAELEKLGFKLLELVAMSLGLRKDRLSPYYKDDTIRIRLNYYPPCPDPGLALGIGRHKDGGVLTVLAQDDVGGLQVRRQTDVEWIDVRPVHDAFIVNLGDILQVWSNDKYKSVEHRAMVNSERERFSIPFFFNPGHDTWVEPLEELVDEVNPSKYRGYNWGKFLAGRNRGNFQKLDVENIQVSDFGI